jgi:hypothetical protein
MRKARIALIPSLLAVAWIIALVSTTQAQSREKFVISARAGGVNAVTGGATVRGQGNSDWQQLTIKEDLETGDVVRTGKDGRVEMLLNPGSYLRLGENSEFELSNSSLENLEVRLIRGTAIVEATGADDTALQINITTPHTKLAIVRRGLYRLNVVPGDATELIVRKGRVMLDRSQTKIKGGNKVVFSSDNFFIAKLEKADKKSVDSLESWSKERAETVAQANRKIRTREMSLLMTGVSEHWSNGFSNSRSGFWYFSSRYGCFTFVPFLMGWGSPYGSSYTNSFYSGFYSNYPFGTVFRGGRGSSSGSPPGIPGIPPAPVPSTSTPPSRPAALEGRIRRHEDRMPNP